MNRRTRKIAALAASALLLLALASCTSTSTADTAPPQESAKPESTTYTAPPPTEEPVQTVTVLEIPTPSTVEPEPEIATPDLIGSLDFDGDDAYLLEKIAMAEAEGEDTEGKALVMLVVLNRVWSDGFPDTIEKVIFQQNQFSPVAPGGRWYTTEPNEDCAAALDLVLTGWDESQGALFFERAGNGSTWQSRNCEYLFQHGNHVFYR